MIHLYENCSCVKNVAESEICLDCATRSSVDFKNSITTRNEPVFLPETYREVWCKIVHGGATWRVARPYNKHCGHPNVRDTQGKCIVCKFERQNEKLTTTPLEQYKQNLAHSVIELRKRADQAEAELMAINFGFIPTHVKTKSPRQFAIEMGEKWYQSDEPCRHCGALSERYVANGRCRSCGK